MGCDIHMHFEIKLDGVWHHYSHPNFPRCYAVFAAMARVRDRGDYEGEQHDPRGLPLDLSPVTAMSFERWKDDAHSLSWLTMPEFRPIALWYERMARGSDKWFSLSSEVLGYLCGNDLYEWTPGSDSYDPRIEDVRVVFWFDN